MLSQPDDQCDSHSSRDQTDLADPLMCLTRHLSCLSNSTHPSRAERDPPVQKTLGRRVASRFGDWRHVWLHFLPLDAYHPPLYCYLSVRFCFTVLLSVDGILASYTLFLLCD